jgi:hypothetical protein
MTMIRRHRVLSRRRALRLERLEERSTPSTFTVLNTNDSGMGSLRQEILDANAAGGANQIGFDIGSGGAAKITLLSTLPALGSSITLDGTTQPGFSNSPVIILTTQTALTVAPGLTVVGNSNTILGLELVGFAKSPGVVGPNPTALLVQGNNNVISGNLIDQNTIGISVTCSDNTIGGITAAARNVIGGNGTGIEITGQAGSPITGDVVEGNYIGTDATGTKAFPKGESFNASVSALYTTGLVIGGTAAGAGNVISGNQHDGIDISSSSGAMVQGNLIGTDATGTQALSNSGNGVSLIDSSSCTVGGASAAARNVISANGGSNVQIDSSQPSTPLNDVIEGNYIGTQIDGQSSLPVESTEGILIGASDNAVLDNTIAFNGRGMFELPLAGILVNHGSGDRISQNTMFDNATTGIQLGTNIYTPNGTNPGAGPNNSQNFPTILSATDSGGNTVITGTLNSQANSAYTLEFYAAGERDPGGSVEGRVFLGSQIVMTDSSGNATFTFTGPANPGPFFTATATDAGGNTSEFWQPNRPAPIITSIDVVSLIGSRGAVSATLTINGSNFFTTTTEQDNGSTARSTSLISSTQLQAGLTFPAVGSVTFNLINPGPGGGGSNSFTVTFTANQVFVYDIYKNLLNRTPDAPGLAFWLGQLEQGVPRSQVVSDIEGSPEYRADELQAVYQRYLHRAADSVGLGNGVTFLENGGTLEQFAAAVIASPEYFQNRGDGTNAGFLNALYLDALNRAIDSGGQSGWLLAFSDGATRYQVAGAIITSLEFRQGLVNSCYAQFLFRKADVAGLDVWVKLLGQGATDETVIAGIMGSQEYFDRARVPAFPG